MKLSALAIATALFSTSVLAAPLTLQTYNPQENAIFAVNSTLASGPHEAVLFDAQFSVKDGEKLVEMIQKSGKKLTRIVITSGDPDFYFGLEPLVKAFPDAKVVATAEVVKHINATKEAKLAYWGPQMKDGAPKQVYVPQALTTNTFSIDGEKVEIRQPQNYAAYVWIPANKAILGGTGVAWGMHVWTADTQSVESRQQWINTLDEMAALHPQQVIPGHYLGTPPAGGRAITFTRDYLTQFEQALNAHKDSAGVIKAMKQRWPGLAEESSLDLSAKVNTGEMKW
ncbi:metallo-beta-lactamase superfamily protein [Klebsiella grimontii]|uniref:Metallo-beta-lactamase superfamily protein n=1 Tax=Klebsiella grimontii TaxID=2058152 RepID=A0A7H4P428_9ENTR|nr:Vmh family MBL fold metallo-hydrolase [Klebsiella grimontii]MEB8266581.1 Vmh family MBL fold metallo-hydrolase [Klebsiella grimontii]STW07193.1 metallo-beta-lactamase superfamily protein [Klebsiella grimontii]